jgi:hypothetical protein
MSLLKISAIVGALAVVLIAFFITNKILDNWNPPNIAGDWCKSGLARITQSGNEIVFFINQGTSKGNFEDGNTVVAKAWGVRGTLNADRSEITWTNGVVWGRAPCNSTFPK